ncbi:MAG: outer membrane beta-barrel protein [Fimbriimonadaceae bacterium]|nr:outer membrane beta-barrel protein [Fimbriimonadaceae bacterium]
MINRTLVVAAAFATLATGAMAQSGSNRPWFALQAGAYFFTSSELRDRFGDPLPSIGIQPFTAKIGRDWQVIGDIKFLTASRDGSRLFVVPVSASVSKKFADPDARVIPIVRVGAGPAYYDYSIMRTSGRVKDRTFGWNTNAGIDFVFDKRWALSFRYDQYSKTDGLDFSGMTVAITFGLVRF